MDSIKTLLAQKLRRRLLNENYFNKKDTILDEVTESIKDLLINLRYTVKHKYKLNFFTNKLIDALVQFKYDRPSPEAIEGAINELIQEYDKNLLKELGIIKVLKKLLKGHDHEKTITSYLFEIRNNIKLLIERYKDKIKTNKKYEIINSINDDTDKITYNKFLKEKYYLQIELLKLQEWAAKNKKKILVIFEGRDAAGKGSNIESITEFLNPKYYRVETFGIPTPEEKKNWFMRYEKVLPKEGEMVFFDRSWYNRGVIEPAMGYCEKEQYEEFMNTVCDWERNLANNGILLVKMWLDIDKLKQKVRFELRKRDPLRYWKFSKNDGAILDNWDKLTPYIDRVLKDTHHEDIPWNIVNSDDKLNGILNSIRTVLDKFDYDHKDYNILNKQKSIIFLDIHGVLITDIRRDSNGEHDCNYGWNKQCISNLNQLTDLTKASIVIISHCKDEMKFKELKTILQEAGVSGNIIGKTINIDKELRAKQINAWFEEHSKPNKWVILDDNAYDDYEYFPEQFVQTKTNDGFTQNELNIALEKLS
jgi:polyphosphate kinase 2